MIKCEKDHCSIKGTGVDLLAELTTIIRALRESMDDEVVRNACDLGFLTDEEIKEKAKEARKELLATMLKMMADIKDMEDEK